MKWIIVRTWYTGSTVYKYLATFLPGFGVFKT